MALEPLDKCSRVRPGGSDPPFPPRWGPSLVALARLVRGVKQAWGGNGVGCWLVARS